MIIEASEAVRNRAKSPHELLMFNLFAFHLLLTPLLLFVGIGEKGVILPPLLSGVVITYIWLRGRKAERQDPWFVMVHWKIALDRAKLLLISYGITAVLLFGAWIITINSGKTQDIMMTVLTRVAVMPTVIMVFVTAVLESSAIYQATRSEVSNGLAKRYPPPDDVREIAGDSVGADV